MTIKLKPLITITLSICSLCLITSCKKDHLTYEEAYPNKPSKIKPKDTILPIGSGTPPRFCGTDPGFFNPEPSMETLFIQ